MAEGKPQQSDATSSCEMPRKRIRFSNTEENDDKKIDPCSLIVSSESEKSVFNSTLKLPSCVSQWSEEHIQGLTILTHYEELTTPAELLNTFKPLYLKNNIMCDQINTIERFLNETSGPSFHNYLDHDFNSLPITVAKKLCKRNKYEIDFEDIKTLGQEVMFWFKRFTECGKRFGEMLYSMILKKELAVQSEGVTATDPLLHYDFQFLFQEFASIFGLYSQWSEPLLQPKVLQMSKAKILGKADILYCQAVEYNPCKSFEQHLNIVAVCEVHKQSAASDEHPHRMSRSSESCTSSVSNDTLPPHIPPKLLGQHGGKLLLYYPQSTKQDVIFGVIVQETKVTFTALKMNKCQYEAIIAGKRPRSAPRLIVTKPYDFMKKEERKYLIRPFLELSMMQKHDWT